MRFTADALENQMNLVQLPAASSDLVGELGFLAPLTGSIPDLVSRGAGIKTDLSRWEKLLVPLGVELLVRAHPQAARLGDRQNFAVHGEANDFTALSLAASHGMPTILAVSGLGEGRNRLLAFTQDAHSRYGYGAEHFSLLGHTGETSVTVLLKQGIQDWFGRQRQTLDKHSDAAIKPFLLGSSTGGLLQLAAAIRDPEQCGPVATLMTPLKFSPVVHQGLRFLHTYAAVPEIYQTLQQHEFRLRTHPSESQPDRPEHSYLLGTPLLSTVQVFALQKFVLENLHLIRKPVLLIQGSEDPYVNLKSTRAIIEKLPNRELFQIEVFNGGHVLSGAEFGRAREFVAEFFQHNFTRETQETGVDRQLRNRLLEMLKQKLA